MIKLNVRTIVKVTLQISKVAGPVTTGILAFKAGMRAKDAMELDQYKIETTEGDNTTTEMVNYDDLDKAQRIRIMAPIILPPVVACAGTIACSFIDKKMDVKYIKQINGVATVALASAAAYRDKLQEIKPEEVENVEQELAEKEYPKEVDLPWNTETAEHSKGVDGDQLFIFVGTGRRFYSNLEFVQSALKKAEYDYNCPEAYFGDVEKDHVCEDKMLAANDVYGYLGLEQTLFGQEFGWCGMYDKTSDEWDYCGDHIHFTVEEGRNGAFYISCNESPMLGWYEI